MQLLSPRCFRSPWPVFCLKLNSWNSDATSNTDPTWTKWHGLWTNERKGNAPKTLCLLETGGSDLLKSYEEAWVSDTWIMNSDPNITNYCNRKSLELSVAFCEIFFFYYSNSDILNPILMHRVQSGNGNEHSEPLFTPVFSCLTEVNTVAYFCFQIRIVDTKIYTSRNSIIMIVYKHSTEEWLISSVLYLVFFTNEKLPLTSL